MKLKEIKLTKEESEYMEHFVKKDETAQVAFQEASKLCKLSRADMWGALTKLYPSAMGKSTVLRPKNGIMTIQYMED